MSASYSIVRLLTDGGLVMECKTAQDRSGSSSARTEFIHTNQSTTVVQLAVYAGTGVAGLPGASYVPTTADIVWTW